ncbi:MAG: cytochrome c-type biogenesis protein CcmH [Burkholderiales bacterium]|nr:cytochrome c-type biogenesis protein CcmH [Burkholderiales bacterium]
MNRRPVGSPSRARRARAAVAALIVALVSAAASAPVAAQAVNPVAPSDPALEARVKALGSELRCLVCQNQTVADSDAPVAQDLRAQVRAQLAAGKSEAEVKQYMTERFGDFVLYKPPFKASTVALWAGPFVVLLVVGALLWRRIVRASTGAGAGAADGEAATLSEADRSRARALLAAANADRAGGERP